MTYTVKKLSSLSGVSVRTLHHYDKLGLLRPALVAENGYRHYSELEVSRLHQILFFKELDFSLSDIKEILNNPEYDQNLVFADHKKILVSRVNRLKKIINLLNQSMNKKSSSSTDFSIFNKSEESQYQAEAKSRWGHTSAYKQSWKKWNGLTDSQKKEFGEESTQINLLLSQLMDKPVSDQDVQALVKRHYAQINFFYDCPLTMYRSLAVMYIEDPRFTATYDKVKPGLAKFLHEAINYFCDQAQ